MNDTDKRDKNNRYIEIIVTRSNFETVQTKLFEHGFSWLDDMPWLDSGTTVVSYDGNARFKRIYIDQMNKKIVCSIPAIVYNDKHGVFERHKRNLQIKPRI